MTAWLDGTKAGYDDGTTWHNYASFGGQWSNNGNKAYFNQTLALAIPPGSSIATFGCMMSAWFGGTGGSPPYRGTIKAIKNSTELVTDHTSAQNGLLFAHATTASVDLNFSDSTPFSLDLTAIVQEVVNESHWASGNKITFTIEGYSGFSGTRYIDMGGPGWYSDSFTLGGGGGGGAGGQSGANAAFFLMLLNEE